MKFIDALAEGCLSADRTFFELYCFLADQCTELQERNKVRLLYRINKEVDLFPVIRQMGIAGEIVLLARHKTVRKLITREKYTELVFFIGSLLIFGERREDGF